MASIELIKGSDGSGNASVATVQSSRSPLASTIVVDTVLGINAAGFAGTMGTPHTFTDPITSETITVISEATAVDFIGHVDGSNLEIDTIAPGYTDLGSEIGDIIIIRPTTQWSDNLADTLAVSHDDDGTLKDNVVTAGVIADDAIDSEDLFTDSVDPVKRASEIMYNNVASGCVWTADAAGSTRVASMTAGIVYIDGKRVVVSAVTSRTFTASKDTYIDVDITGTLTYTEVTNNAASPALAASSIRLGIVVTAAGSIAAGTSINQGDRSTATPIVPTKNGTVFIGHDSLGNSVYPTNLALPGQPAQQWIGTGETRASGTYGDLATVGPQAMVRVGKSGCVLVSIACQMAVAVNTAVAFAGIDISGANTVVASAQKDCLIFQPATATGSGIKAGAAFLITGLTPGLTNFKLQYRTDGNTGTFSNRQIAVMPL